MVNMRGATVTALTTVACLLLLPTQPPAQTTAPGRPTDVRVNVSNAFLAVLWTRGPGATPTSHRLDFFSGSTPVAQATVGASNFAEFAIPPGTQGRFSVQVTPFAGSIAGPASPATFFDIGQSGPGCTAPPPPPDGVASTFLNGFATVRWNAAQDATSYIVRAGRGQNLSDLFNGNVGSNTAVSAGGLPPTFSAFVRVLAQNDCGVSTPTPDFLLGGAPCVSDADTICALNDRFAIDVNWRDATGAIGRGLVTPSGRFNDGGEFYFFAPSNTELLVRVLDGCRTNDRFWVFLSGSTNVEVGITVTDTQRGVGKSYTNPLNRPFQPIQDTNAFATCP